MNSVFYFKSQTASDALFLKVQKRVRSFSLHHFIFLSTNKLLFFYNNLRHLRLNDVQWIVLISKHAGLIN